MSIAQIQHPSVIDRQFFFGEIEIAEVQISPDGQWLSFLKPYNGVRNVWVKKLSDPFTAARPLSAETQPIGSYFWAHNSQHLLYMQDDGGDQNFNLYSIALTVDPKASVQAARALTGLHGVKAILFASPKAKPDFLYIGLNDRDPQWHDLYELRISTGEKELMRKNTERISKWIFDHNGDLRAAERTSHAGDIEILNVTAEGFRLVYNCSILDSCSIQGFTPDNKLAYLLTNKGSLNLIELQTLDLASGATTKLESDPQERVDFVRMEISQGDHRILYTEYDDDRPRQRFHNENFEQEYRWLQSKLPGMEIGFGSRSHDESVWIVNVHSDTEPGEAYVWDRAAKTLTLQYRIREELPRDSLSERKIYHYKSSDGLDIPAYLTLPKGFLAKNLPLIVFPHRGPWERDSFGYSHIAQYLANRGYAVLQPNFRGSTGYGKKFTNAGNGEWGRKMQDDITWGIQALVTDGIADPKRVGIAGESYGGYATLSGAAFTPQVYAAAFAVVGPSNLITLLESIPPYWEARRKLLYARMADPTTSAGRELLIAQSPLTKANDIITPLVVVQGKNDPLVNIRESDQIVAAVRDNGKPIEYLVAPDEGHGFTRPINVLAMVTKMEKFFATHLGGRHQQDVSSDIEAQLRSLTVDPTTVNPVLV